MTIFNENPMNSTRALYLPAIQPSYATSTHKGGIERTIPIGASCVDFDFLQPNSNFFNLNTALYSIGNISNPLNPPKCIVTERDKSQTLILGDSGGYQIAKQRLNPSIFDVRRTYDWLVKYTDVSITLDYPTFNMPSANWPFYNPFDDRLAMTLNYLGEFNRLGAKKHKFLNVLQGETPYDCDIWYDYVKKFDFYGWSISGLQRSSMFHMLFRILTMIKHGKFDKDEIWLHFLGVGTLKAAVLFTALQKALNLRFPNCNVIVSFDTSSPFLVGGRYFQYFDYPTITSENLAIKYKSINKHKWMTSDKPFPCTYSTVGASITKNDIVFGKSKGEVKTDRLSYLLLQNHNIESALKAVNEANDLLYSGIPTNHLKHLFPEPLITAKEIIFDILLASNFQKGFQLLMNKHNKSNLWQHAKFKDVSLPITRY